MFRLLSYVGVFILGLLIGNGTLTKVDFSPLVEWVENQVGKKDATVKVAPPKNVSSSVQISQKKTDLPHVSATKASTSVSALSKETGSLFAVQIGAFKDLADAKSFVTKLNEEHINAYVAPGSEYHGQHRVFVGKYMDKPSAVQKLRVLKKRFHDAFVQVF